MRKGGFLGDGWRRTIFTRHHKQTPSRLLCPWSEIILECMGRFNILPSSIFSTFLINLVVVAVVRARVRIGGSDSSRVGCDGGGAWVSVHLPFAKHGQPSVARAVNFPASVSYAQFSEQHLRALS